MAGASGGHRISTKAAKAGYIALILLSSLFAFVLYFWGDQITWLTDIAVLKAICTNNGVTESQCYGSSAVIRVSLALCIFFAVNVLASFSADAFVGMWSIKLLVWLGLIIGMFFVPANAIVGYAQTARVFSVLFIIAMVMLLIDFAYHMQEALVDKIEATNAELLKTYKDIGWCQNVWRWLYIALVFGLMIASFTGIVVLYHFSANRPSGDCGQNLGFLSFTLISGLSYTVLSTLACIGKGAGMLTPSIIFAYCTWLCWSAINTNPDDNCNPLPPDRSNTASTVIGMLIAAGSLCYTAFSASRSLPKMFHAGRHAHDSDASGATTSSALLASGPGGGSASAGATAPAGSAAGAAKYADPEEAEDDSEDGGVQKKGNITAGAPSGGGALAAHKQPAELPYSAADSAIFIVIMVLASMYLAPVTTNWVTDPSDVEMSRSSPAAMWVNISSQWACIVLFLWTLIAPFICPNREFR